FSRTVCRWGRNCGFERSSDERDECEAVPPRPEGRVYTNKPGEPGCQKAIVPHGAIAFTQPGSPGMFVSAGRLRPAVLAPWASRRFRTKAALSVLRRSISPAA